MKKFYLKLLGLGFVFFSHAGFSQTNPDSGLIAYYPFDSNAMDLGPYGLHGTVNGASLTNDRFGRDSMAYSFNGSGNTITVSGLCSKLEGEVSFAFWTISNTSKDQSVFMGVPDDINNRLNLHYNYNHNFQNSLFFDYGSIFSGGRIHVIPFTLSSAWTHVAVISSAAKDSMYMYVNGTLVQKQKGHDTHSSTKIFSFGATTGLYYQGAIDEFRTYNRVISDAEVLALATARPSAIPEEHLNYAITAFPNPSNQGIYNLTGNTILESVQVYTVTGALVTELNNINDTKAAIDLHNEKPAVYFASVRDTNNRRSVIKLVKSQ